MRNVPKKLYLVDGANLLFRAFYAIRALSTSKGLPTNALYGLAQMLLALKRDEKPDYLAVLFDTKEPTFRDELYADYKANRKEPPDDLVLQFPYVKPLVEALGIPTLEKAGFEADDLIGTVAKALASDDLHVVIVSGDKDLMQLVNEHVSILDTMKEERIGPAEVEKRFGVPPDKVIEVLGLMGDSSDNIPGVPGVGPKTATQLIQEYGSIENVITNAEKLKGTLVDKIKEHTKLARLSRQLVTIDANVAITISLDALVVRSPDPARARPLLSELEFTKLLGELAPSGTLSHADYRLIQDEKECAALFERAQKSGRCSLDLETTALSIIDAEIVGISMALSPGEAFYIPIGHQLELGERQLPKEYVLNMLRQLLQSTALEIVGQNLKYDLAILKRLGIEAHGKLFDTMIASYLLNPSSQHNLDALSQLYLGHTTITYEDVTGKGKKQILFDRVPLDRARDYAAEDADVALQLADLFRGKLAEAGLVTIFEDLEMPLLSVLMDMELTGVLIDASILKRLSDVFGEKLHHLETDIHQTAGGATFNINSPKQLGDVLFGKLQLPGARKTKTGFSTSQDVLEELALTHPLPKLILEYRSLSKLKSTYIDALPELINKKTGRLHTSFNQTVAATGRLSSSDPNLQNIPIRREEGKKIRRAFVVPAGFLLLDCDYSQIELRVLAHLSRDETLLDAYARGLDVHAATASGIFGCPVDQVTAKQRAVGKTVNFATIYGQSAFGLSQQLSIDPKEATSYIERYFKNFPRVAAYRDDVLKRARQEGMVKTLFGRRRLVPDINASHPQVRQAAERVAFNTVFQGTAADIIKRAMIAIHAELSKLSPRTKMILSVHDELVFEVPAADVEKVKSFVVEKMTTAATLDVPLVVDVGIGENWATAH